MWLSVVKSGHCGQQSVKERAVGGDGREKDYRTFSQAHLLEMVHFLPLGQKQMLLDYTLNIVLLSIAVSPSAYYVLFSLSLREQNCNETNGLNISV